MSKLKLHRASLTIAQRREAGDTLVEVLISIAVVSMVLAVAYGTTNRNISTGQDTQERSQALQLAQQQVELLRTRSQTIGMDGFQADSCIVKEGSDLKFKTGDTCFFTSDGAPDCDNEADICYDVRLKLDGTTDAYTVTLQWPSIHGGTSTIALGYRV